MEGTNRDALLLSDLAADRWAAASSAHRSARTAVPGTWCDKSIVSSRRHAEAFAAALVPYRFFESKI
jgi:hypothetical protein